jgi:pimeloyl-ACP methyl ester carboxylesterase
MIARALRFVLKAIGGLLALVLLVLLGFRIAAGWRETETGMPAASHLVATPLGAVAVQVIGPADGPPILLVPGTAGWSGFWSHVSAHLAGRGWRVIAVDLPPFGYSEHDPEARYDRASQAARLAAVIAAEGHGRAAVVAHSFGAGAATELALRNPRQVTDLVLVDAALGALDPAPADRGQTEWLLRRRWIAQPIVSASLTNPLLTGRLFRSLLARKEAAAPWLDIIQAPMRREGTTAAYAAWLPFLLTADDGALSRRSANLRRIAVPVFLIWGGADSVTPPAQGQALARLMHASAFVSLGGVGHIPHIENEAVFLQVLDVAVMERR